MDDEPQIKLFCEFLEAAKTTLSESERTEVQYFVNVNEFGFALQTAIGIYLEEGKSPDQLTLSVLRQLAALMDAEQDIRDGIESLSAH
jgi:hypothetical protein